MLNFAWVASERSADTAYPTATTHWLFLTIGRHHPPFPPPLPPALPDLSLDIVEGEKYGLVRYI